VEAILGYIYIKFYHWAYNHSKYADGFYNSMIDDKDGHMPSPLIMFTCTALLHPVLQWQKNEDVYPKSSKSKLKADKPDCSNYFNYKNDGGKIASCSAATGHKVSTPPGVAYMYTSLMNTWNTLPESYQQRVYKNTVVTVKRQIQQAENPTPAAVITTEAAHVDNSILLHNLTPEVVLQDPDIGHTDPNILIDNNCMDGQLHFGMPWGCDENDDEGDEIDESDAIPTTIRRQRAATELERFDLGTSDVDGYEGDYGDNADADEEEDASQANDGLTHTLED
jgi:hypothetical protein